MISISSELEYGKIVRSLLPAPVQPIQEEDYWPVAQFTLNMVVISLDFMPVRTDKLKIKLGWCCKYISNFFFN